MSDVVHCPVCKRDEFVSPCGKGCGSYNCSNPNCISDPEFPREWYYQGNYICLDHRPDCKRVSAE